MERTRREFIRESTTLLAGAALLAEAPSLRAALESACGADLTGCAMESVPYDWSLNEAR